MNKRTTIALAVMAIALFGLLQASGLVGWVKTTRQLDVKQMLPWAASGNKSAYTYPLKHVVSDTDSKPHASRAELLENGVKLGPPHSLHSEINESGAGRYSICNGVLVFSSSDNTNPAGNSRAYSLREPLFYGNKYLGIFSFILLLAAANLRRLRWLEQLELSLLRSIWAGFCSAAWQLFNLLLQWLPTAVNIALRSWHFLTGMILMVAGFWVTFLVAKWSSPTLGNAALLKWLAPYSPDLKQQIFTFGIYFSVLATVILWFRRPLFIRQAKNYKWLLLAIAAALVFTRIMGIQHSIYSYEHADWGSFFGYHWYSLAICREWLQHPIVGFFKFLKQLAAVDPVITVSVFCPVPSFLMGISATIVDHVIKLAGYTADNPFYQFGKFLGPAFNLAYVFLLTAVARNYVFTTRKAWPALLLMALLVFLPVHIYMGSVINYNLLADSLLLALLLCSLQLIRCWLLLEKEYIRHDYTLLPLRGFRPLLATLLIFWAAFGLLAATKWTFYSIVLVNALAYLLLLGRYFWQNKRGRGLYFLALSALFASMLAGGLLCYLAIVAKNIVHDPVRWGKILYDIFYVGMAKAPFALPGTFVMFYQVILVPNIGYVNAVAGSLGLILFTGAALSRRSLPQIILAAWAWLLVLQTLSSHLLLWDGGNMGRNTLLLGTFVMFSVYFLARMLAWLSARVQPRARKAAVTVFITVFSVEMLLGGLSVLAFFSNRSAHRRAEDFIARNIPQQSKIGTPGNPLTWWHPFYPRITRYNFTYNIPPHTGRGWELDLISRQDADYWVVSNNDQELNSFVFSDYKLPMHHSLLARQLYLTARNSFRESLRYKGYSYVYRFGNDCPACGPLEPLYRHYITPLLGSEMTGGIQTPSFIEVYSKKPLKAG